MSKLQRLELLKDMIQQAVDRGATSVEQIHQYIADLPFEALERAGLLDGDPSTSSGQATLKVREKKTRTIGMVYDAIRGINKQIGDLISDQFENFEDGTYVARVLKEREAPRAKAARKKPPRRKA